MKFGFLKLKFFFFVAVTSNNTCAPILVNEYKYLNLDISLLIETMPGRSLNSKCHCWSFFPYNKFTTVLREKMSSNLKLLRISKGFCLAISFSTYYIPTVPVSNLITGCHPIRTFPSQFFITEQNSFFFLIF